MAGRFMVFHCSACSTDHHVPRGIAVVCPRCEAGAGDPCVDLRPGRHRAPRVNLHPERDALIMRISA